VHIFALVLSINPIVYTNYQPSFISGVLPWATIFILIVCDVPSDEIISLFCCLQDQILSYIDNNNLGVGDSAARRNRLDRLMFRTNERLPGAVLQAQARVLERLRGISLGSSVSRPSISLDEFSASDVFRIIDFRNREARHEENRHHSSSFHPSSESDEERPTVGSTHSNRSTGLTKAAFLRLQVEIFEASKDDSREASPECSICLDGFYDGDELIRLRCGHRFHSTCLEPWARKCADCPYCRTNIRSRS
jgi:hypothetical protein